MSSMSDQIPLDQLLNGGFLEQPTKPLTKPVDTNAKTLESYHAQNLTKIRSEKSQLPELRSQLQAKKAEYHKIEALFQSPLPITTADEITQLTNRQKVEKEIHELEDKIAAIEAGTSESDYFLRVGDILFSYSDAQERIAAGQKSIDTFAKKRMPANSVYSYFVADAMEAGEYAEVEEEDVGISKAAAVSTELGFRRDKALETYLSALNPDNIHSDAAMVCSLEENYGCCPVCETEMFFNETFLDCSECGYREYILVDSEKPSYKDPPREMSYYAYKKINHLNEWLAQFQAKETTEIPPAVLEQIRAELRKERITDMSKLKVSKLKEVLKKLKLSRCYDHVAHILNRLNGISAPVLSREVEEKLRYMFKEIQFSFVKHCPKKRSNFLSYSFVLYKFCELLELDEYLPCFPLLKSREKLYMQDKIWELICKDLDWQFIRTV